MPVSTTQAAQHSGHLAGQNQTPGASAANRHLRTAAQQLSTAAPLNSVVGFADPVQTTLTPSTPPQERPRRPQGLLSQALSSSQQAPTEPRHSSSSTASHSDMKISDSESAMTTNGSEIQASGSNSPKTQPIPIPQPGPKDPHYEVNQKMQVWRDQQTILENLNKIKNEKAKLKELMVLIANTGIIVNQNDIGKLDAAWAYIHRQIPNGIPNNVQEHLNYILTITNLCNQLIQEANASINVS